MVLAVLNLSVVLLVVGVCVADMQHTRFTSVSEDCLDCICKAVSGCEQGAQCNGDHCGPFHITRAYWVNAGKPTINGESPDAPDAYDNCANNPMCARGTVRAYMHRYAEDCNGDGRVDCYDIMATQKLGRYGCTGQLPRDYVNFFNQCFASAPENQN